MIRVSFNGGELAPGVRCRPDLEVYQRGCSRVENFDIAQMGGVSRRRGMKGVLDALPASRIYPYVYSATLTYIVEIAPSGCRVISPDGDVIFELSSPPWNAAEVASLRVRQVNKYLIITCSTQPVMALSTDDGAEWKLERWLFKSPPLRHTGARDTSLTLRRHDDWYNVEFDANEVDRSGQVGDMLSVEITVPTATAYASINEWRAASKGLQNFSTISAASTAKAGHIVFVREGSYNNWYECIKDFNGSADFVPGKTTPSDYHEHFVKGAPYGRELPCKGTWKFHSSGTWYGEMGIERRYPDEKTWTCVATSFSQVGAASNLQPTGDEGAEECYLRLRVYREYVSGVMPDSSSLQLVVSQYRKRVLLKLHDQDGGVGVYVSKFAIPANTNDKLLLPEGKQYTFTASRLIDADGSTVMQLSDGTVRRMGDLLHVTLAKEIELCDIPEAATGMQYDLQIPASKHTLTELGYHYYLIPMTPNATITTWTAFYERDYITYWEASILYYEFYEDVFGARWWHIDADAPDGDALRQSTHALRNRRSCMCAVELRRLSYAAPCPVTPRAELTINAGQAVYTTDFARNHAVRPGSVFAILDPIKESCLDYVEATTWSWEAFTSAYGYPSLCDTYQQRLVFACTVAQPQTVWMSKTDDLNDFEISSDDDGALDVTLSTTTQNPITWLLAQNARLLLGTADSEWTISGGEGGITATTARADNSGFVGAASVPAMMATDKCVYIERGGGRAYQYGYNYEADAYMSTDLTVFADHILRDGGGVVSGCFLRKPDPRAVFVLADGTLAIMTYNNMHNVNAWHRYTTDGRIECAIALPNGHKSDLLYLIVERTSDGGATHRMIEVIAPDNDYIDNGGHDYTSTLVCNALDTVETASSKRQGTEASYYFAAATDLSGVEISSDGVTWAQTDRPSAGAGWLPLVTWTSCTAEVRPGIRVSGNRGIEILALKA